MSTRTRIWAVAVAALALVVAVAVVFVLVGRGDDTSPTDPAPQVPDPPSAAVVPPSPGTGFGAPTTDFTGRRVDTPNNTAGQPLPQREPTGERVDCTVPGSDAAAVTSPDGVAVQNTVGAVSLVSVSDGPVRVDGRVLTGYATSAQGAVLAGWNLIARSYADSVTTVDVVDKLVVANEITDRLRAAAAAENKPQSAYVRSVLAPEAFRITTCSIDFVSAEYALPMPVDDTGARRTAPVWQMLRMALYRQDGDWKGRLDADSVRATGQIASLDGWTKWALS